LEIGSDQIPHRYLKDLLHAIPQQVRRGGIHGEQAPLKVVNAQQVVAVGHEISKPIFLFPDSRPHTIRLGGRAKNFLWLRVQFHGYSRPCKNFFTSMNPSGLACPEDKKTNTTQPAQNRLRRSVAEVCGVPQEFPGTGGVYSL
jgi:hypothetical protein